MKQNVCNKTRFAPYDMVIFLVSWGQI